MHSHTLLPTENTATNPSSCQELQGPQRARTASAHQQLQYWRTAQLGNQSFIFRSLLTRNNSVHSCATTEALSDEESKKLKKCQWDQTESQNPCLMQNISALIHLDAAEVFKTTCDYRHTKLNLYLLHFNIHPLISTHPCSPPVGALLQFIDTCGVSLKRSQVWAERISFVCENWCVSEQNAANAHFDLVEHTSMNGFGWESGDKVCLASIKCGKKLRWGDHVHAINK